MFGISARSRTNWDEIERRLNSVEQSVRRDGRRLAKAMPSTDQAGEMVASALNAVAERFRGISVGDEAARIGNEAAKFGNYAVRRVSKEVAHRPLIALGIAVGVGVLLGLPATAADQRRRPAEASRLRSLPRLCAGGIAASEARR